MGGGAVGRLRENIASSWWSGADQMRKSLGFTLFVALTLLFATSPNAQYAVSFPEYPDPTPACAKQFRSDIFEIKDCIEKNQSGYDQARAFWPIMSEVTQSICKIQSDRMAEWGRYRNLGICAKAWYYQYDLARRPVVPLITGRNQSGRR